MCGIFGFVNKKTEPVSTILEGLKSLEYRGYDSWGVAFVSGSYIEIIKKTGKIGNSIIAPSIKSSIAIGHTRWATHGGVTEINAHPHTDCTKTIAIIHNGIITNYLTLKQSLIKTGHVFTSETDSEVAAHLIEEYCKTDRFEEAVRKSFLSLEGMNALVVTNTQSGQLVAIKNGSPLIVGIGPKGTYVASDPYTLSPFVDSIHVLRDGQMATLTTENISVQEIKTGKKLTADKTIPPKQFENETKTHYLSLMEKEMNEQPSVLSQIARKANPQEKTITIIRTLLAKKKQIIFIGCGSAYFAGLTASYMFAAMQKKSATAVSASEVALLYPDICQDTLIVALSQSGETADTLRAIEWAKTKGATVISLVNVPHSAISRISDVTLELSAGQEKAVASTKAFTAKLAWLYRIFSNNQNECSETITKSGIYTQQMLSEPIHSQILTIAKNIKDANHILVVGHGAHVPIAFEIAMKIKEITYIHAEGMTSTELKHGPIALVTKGTPCIVLTSGTHDVIAENAASELKARGAFVLGIGYKKQPVFDEFIEVPEPGILQIIPMTVIGQSLAFTVADFLGLDPDKPRNLAKSVTV